MVSGQFLQTLVDEIGEALVSWTVAGEITTWNRAAEALLGYRREDILGRNAAIMVPAGLLSDHEAMIQTLVLSGVPARISTTRRRADGELIDVSLSLSRICNHLGEVVGVGCLMRSRARASRLVDRLRRRACTDALTGAMNRAGIEDRLGNPRRMAAGGQRAVLFIDLDGFKRVNDEAGHRRGDQLLRRCASRLRNALGDEGHVLGRWGGDEFVVVLENLPDAPGAARRAAERVCGDLLEALRPTYRFANGTHSCPASIGACVYDPQETLAVDALDIADRAMYQVKSEGKDAFLVDSASGYEESQRDGTGRMRIPFPRHFAPMALA